MSRIILIHWNTDEAQARLTQLNRSGILASLEKFAGPATLRTWKENPPTAIIIDLSRLPSSGRDIAVAVRHYKTTRHIPLLLVDGRAEKLQQIQKLLPDVTYTDWDHIDMALKQAIDHPPVDPVVPRSMLEGYAGTPLVKKLGIKANSNLVIINAPAKFEEKLENMPDNVAIKYKIDNQEELIIWFIRYIRDMEVKINSIIKAMHQKGSLWIAWPKKSSGVSSDLTQNVVRQIGLANGLVDYKICAIDELWSALKFSLRK